MMKNEFEVLINKYVDEEVFNKYNAMYMAVDVDKQEFVKMLNIKAIPESERIIRRREELNKRLESLKEDLAYYVEKKEGYKFMGYTAVDYAWLDKVIRDFKEDIKWVKLDIKGLTPVEE